MSTQNQDYKNVQSFEDACKIVGHDPSVLPDVSMLPAAIGDYLLAMFMLLIIVKAINPEGWEADYGNHDQYKYYPWFYVNRGYKAGSGSGGFSYFGYVFVYAATCVRARLAFADEERAEYAGTQFIDLYEKVQLVVK